MVTLALVFALALIAPVDASKCEPACARGETCTLAESCYDTGCTERWICEGTPDDCRTNGCQGDHEACLCAGGNEYVCEEKACDPRPQYIDCFQCWRCVEWSTTKDSCCHQWT
jgi:hypothetical protein